MDSVAVAVAAVPVESAIAGKRLALIQTPKESPAQTSALQGHYAARAGSSPENGMIKRAAFNIERLIFRLGTPHLRAGFAESLKLPVNLKSCRFLLPQI